MNPDHVQGPEPSWYPKPNDNEPLPSAPDPVPGWWVVPPDV